MIMETIHEEHSKLTDSLQFACERQAISKS